ncbi:MAG: hypothetical protein KA319_12340 [Ferruginibacter sp.]|nr:hypothetical protein [Ferruginibacter sp.]
MKQLIILTTALFLTFTVTAQETKNSKKAKKEEKRKKIDALIKQEEEGVIAYKKSFGGGFKLTSDGYGAFLEKGIAKSIKKSWLFQLEITERKHAKEEKITPFGFGTGVPFVYGKINFMYPVKLGVQMQVLLGNKQSKNGVSITANVGGGISLGLLRPYFISMDTGGSKRADIRYESKDSSLFLTADEQITAEGPTFGKGWNKLKVTPGLYIKPSLRFDYGRYNEMISALEVGLIGEFYSKKIPQMVYQKQRQFFFSAYVALVFGRRK